MLCFETVVHRFFMKLFFILRFNSLWPIVCLSFPPPRYDPLHLLTTSQLLPIHPPQCIVTTADIHGLWEHHFLPPGTPPISVPVLVLPLWFSETCTTITSLASLSITTTHTTGFCCVTIRESGCNTVQVGLVNYPGVSGRVCFLTVARNLSSYWISSPTSVTYRQTLVKQKPENIIHWDTSQ